MKFNSHDELVNASKEAQKNGDSYQHQKEEK